MLEIDESTTILLVKHSNLTIVENSNSEDNIYLANYNYNYSNSLLNINQSLTESTFFHTKINEDNSVIQDMYELKFNFLRANFCLKYNLYDIPLVLEIFNYIEFKIMSLLDNSGLNYHFKKKIYIFQKIKII